MVSLDVIHHDFWQHAFPLGWLFAIFFVLFIATFLGKSLFNRFQISKHINLNVLRIYLLSLLFMLALTVLYWIIDTHFTNLPNPVLPYTLYILLIAIFFSTRVALITATFSFLLFDYYLFEPRYHLYTSQDALSIFYSIVGLLITLFVGLQIRRYQRHLLQKTDELEMLIKARDQFSAIAAHDLKNPITTIKLYSQMLGHKNAGKKTEAVLSQSTEIINRETDKLLSMIDSLLDFSKLQEGKLKLNKKQINLLKLCKECVAIMQTNYPDHTFTFHTTLKTATVYVDKISLDRVLTNLLSNAAKYSPVRTKITLEVIKQRNEYIISVHDQGKGIPQKEQQKLFEPFYQAANGKQGLGLGLYIVKTIVQLHGGKIWLKSEPDKGSTFFVSLPARKKS